MMLPRPIIMVVDDEPARLAQLLDALSRRFGADYRVVPHLSARDALDEIPRLTDEGEEIALLDNYLVKPWSPPEVHRDPPISEFLAEWTAGFRPRVEIVRVIAEEPSPRAHEIRELPHAAAFPMVSIVRRQMPVAAFSRSRGSSRRRRRSYLLDGRALAGPSNTEISDALGASNADETACDLLIVGGGPGGLAAAVYAASEGVRPRVIGERE